MSKITEEARLLCNGTRYKIEFDLGDQTDDQRVILRRGDLARIEKIAGLVPELVNEVDRWQQIAIRERANRLIDDPDKTNMCPHHNDGCLEDCGFDWCPSQEHYLRMAAKELDSEVKGIIIAEEGDVEALRDLSRIIELLKEGRTPAMMEEDLVGVEAAVERWQKQLGGQL